MDPIFTLITFLVPLITLPLLPILSLSFKILNYLLRSKSTENVAGKVVLITGASSGIGEHLAYEYAKRGACLALAARRREKLEAVAKKARELGSPDVIIEITDISKVEDCKRFVDAAVNHFGKLDHLVNNAGFLQVSLLEDVSNFEDFASVMDINFWGSVYCTRFAIPHLKQSKGKIGVISSAAAWLPTPRFSIYSGSKGAVVSFFETLRAEIGPDVGITISTPGLVDSEMTTGETFKKTKLDFAPKQPTEDCARAIFNSICRGDRFLLDPANYKIVYLWRLFCPELVDLIQRRLLPISSKDD